MHANLVLLANLLALANPAMHANSGVGSCSCGCGCTPTRGCGVAETASADLAAPPTLSSVEWTPEEPELWRGRQYSRPAVDSHVLVLDTGLAPDAIGGKISGVHARSKEAWGPTKKKLPPPKPDTDNRDPHDANNDDWLDPVAGHGTFIAGIIARLAPGAEVAVGKVLENTGEGDDADIAFRINAVIQAGQRPDILVLSCSCYSENDNAPLGLASAVARIQALGTVVVAAAGNDGSCRVTWPAALPGVISVGALGPDGPAEFSNWGSWVKACAPGVDVVGSFYNGVDEHDDENPKSSDFQGWARWSGTSFAAPIVAAAIAREQSLYGISAVEAADRVVHDRRLYRIPGMGTVVNVH